MSIFTYIFDNEVFQRRDINNLNARLGDLRRRQATTNVRRARKVDDLENDVAELALLCKAMYGYMKSKPGYDAEAFRAILERLDASDGKRDGKLSRQ